VKTGSVDLYAILGLESSASADEIKRAYRKLARQYHPDVSSESDAEQRFKEINLAYEVLSDPQRRQQYDSFGTTSEQGAAGGSPFGGGGFSSINDIFDFFFSGGMGGFGQPPRGTRRGFAGEDIERSVHLKLVDVLADKAVSLNIERREPCEACHGSGAEAGSQPQACTTCGGHGQVMQVRDTLLGRMQTITTCPACHGDGQTVGEPCKTCRGTGTQYHKRSIDVTIPPGVDDGNIMRVSGQGHCGKGGGPPGDLLVNISIEPDKRFRRSGAELITATSVHFADLALGATIDVETLEGTEKLRVPAGTASHHEFVLRGHGLPRLRGSGRGSLHVQVIVDVPHKLERRQRELLEELRGLDNPPPDPEGVAPPKKRSRLFEGFRKGN